MTMKISALQTIAASTLLCISLLTQPAEATEDASATNTSISAGKAKSPYAHLVKLENQGNGVAFVHPDISPLAYDSIYFEPIAISYDDGIDPLPEKTIKQVAKQVTQNENDWLKQTGLDLVDAPEKCAINYRIRLADINYDADKLKRSENFRRKVYGSMIISSELRTPDSNELIAIWLQKVPLATNQKDKGKANRKIAKSMQRIAIDSIEKGYESYAEQTDIYQQTSAAAPGCSANLSNSDFRRH